MLVLRLACILVRVVAINSAYLQGITLNLKPVEEKILKIKVKFGNATIGALNYSSHMWLTLQAPSLTIVTDTKNRHLLQLNRMPIL